MPWKILHIEYRPTAFYKYCVHGENTEASPVEPFRWEVPSLKDARYVAHESAPLDVAVAVSVAKTRDE